MEPRQYGPITQTARYMVFRNEDFDNIPPALESIQRTGRDATFPTAMDGLYHQDHCRVDRVVVHCRLHQRGCVCLPRNPSLPLDAIVSSDLSPFCTRVVVVVALDGIVFFPTGGHCQHRPLGGLIPPSINRPPPPPTTQNRFANDECGHDAALYCCSLCG